MTKKDYHVPSGKQTKVDIPSGEIVKLGRIVASAPILNSELNTRGRIVPAPPIVKPVKPNQ